MIVSLMVPCEEANWKAILPHVEETEADGIELNFGCPHGMSERGMGCCRGPGAGICRDGGALVQAAHPHAGDRQADAQHHRRPQTSRSGEARRGRCGVADQYHQFDHGRRSRRHGARTPHRWQGNPWRLLRCGGASDRAQHGGRDRARRSHARHADFRHRRHRDLARMRRSSWRWAPALSRSAPPRWSMASRSSKR